MTQEILLVVLSIGFVVLVVFVCVAIGAMIKILVDVRKITEAIKKSTDSVSETVDAVSEKTKSFFANSLVIDKIIPALLGVVSMAVGAKKVSDKFREEEDKEEKVALSATHRRGGKKKGRFSKSNI